MGPEEEEICIDQICFVKPHQLYVPPFYYKPIPARKYRWKVAASVGEQCYLKIQRVLDLPNCFGLGDDARWRWQWYPLSLALGMKLSRSFHFDSSTQTTGFARVKFMTPVFGKLALRPVVEILPVPGVSLQKTFNLGNAQVTVTGGVEVNALTGLVRGPLWSMRINWQDAKHLFVQPGGDGLIVDYARKLNLAENCRAVATGLAKLPSSVVSGGIDRIGGSLPVFLKLGSLKISKIFNPKAKRPKKLPRPAAYSKASDAIGTRDVITIVPGHWIDPGYEAGAPGEREFNLEVANALERQLYGNGWKVLRPDRDAPQLSWEEYLNWVSKQTLKGTPVLEIHGQGSNADYRGLVLGVIGDENARLSQELAQDFGFFDMDWTDLAVPRRGGIILESFNADEVLEMAQWHRTLAVRRLSNRISSCIERAASENRAARGIHVKPPPEDDLFE